MKTIVFDTPSELDSFAAQLLYKQLNDKPDSSFCFAGGNTTKGIHAAILSSLEFSCDVFRKAYAFVLDEYFGVGSDNPAGVAGRLKAQVLDHAFQRENVYLFDSTTDDPKKACEEYDRRWFEMGIDFEYLGLGENGHLGFNEPGTSFLSKSHLVKLSEETRQSKAHVFGSYENVPYYGITVGLNNIMSAKKIVLAVKGESKSAIVRKVVQGNVSEQIPATILRAHPGVTLLLDKAAAALL